MRIAHSTIARSQITLVISGCAGSAGPIIIGVNGGNGGDGSGGPSLDFFVQPNTANVGQIITPAVEVVVRDSLGGTDSSFTGSITIGLGLNSTGASLSGTTVERPTNGIATFNNLAIDQVGTYTLSASASGASTASSSAFLITTTTGP